MTRMLFGPSEQEVRASIANMDAQTCENEAGKTNKKMMAAFALAVGADTLIGLAMTHSPLDPTTTIALAWGGYWASTQLLIHYMYKQTSRQTIYKYAAAKYRLTHP